MPDGNPQTRIHSHQPFAQSWILAGEGTNVSYNVEPTQDNHSATHAEYSLAWGGGNKPGTTYKTQQTHSVIVNAKTLVRVTPTNSTTHAIDTSYTIPSATFHSTEVPPEVLHATLFFFDSSRGFHKDAPVLGPKDAESFTQLREPPDIPFDTLASRVDVVRRWDIYFKSGLEYVHQDLELALRSFNSALYLCDSTSDFPNVTHYRPMVLGQLGNMYRRLGRYEQAKDVLESAVTQMNLSPQRVELSGKLGVVYRYKNQLTDAKHAFEVQYNSAKQLNVETALCHAVGSLGIVNCQLSQQDDDETLLELAIKQLSERVWRARKIKDATGPTSYTTMLEAVGLARLSLCYTARGDSKKALNIALESLEIAQSLQRTQVIALSRLFYGRALIADGQREEALKQLNPPEALTPAMALCNEPSNEHNGYLQELVDLGVDMDRVDHRGYTALDYAVFSGNTVTEALVLEGLRRTLRGHVTPELLLRQTQAKLRKAYRELFQDKLRRVLLAKKSGEEVLQELRHAYADALANDVEKSKVFDELKFVRYPEFVRFGKLPRSSDGLAQRFKSKSDQNYKGSTADFIIFFSYTRLNRDARASSPDDANHTQYRRMIEAAEEFLRLHPSVDRENLKIWVVSRNRIISASVINLTCTGSCLRRPGRPHNGCLRLANNRGTVRRHHQPRQRQVL